MTQEGCTFDLFLSACSGASVLAAGPVQGFGPSLQHTKENTQKSKCRQEHSASGLHSLTPLCAYFNHISFLLSDRDDSTLWLLTLAFSPPWSDNLVRLISLAYLPQLSAYNFQLSTLYIPSASQTPAAIGTHPSPWGPQVMPACLETLPKEEMGYLA